MHTYTHEHTHTNIHIGTQTQIHTHVQTQIHTHVHTQTCIHNGSSTHEYILVLKQIMNLLPGYPDPNTSQMSYGW